MVILLFGIGVLIYAVGLITGLLIATQKELNASKKENRLSK